MLMLLWKPFKKTIVPLLDYLNKEGIDITDKVKYITDVRSRLESQVLSSNEAHAMTFNIATSKPELPSLFIPESNLNPKIVEGNIRDLAWNAISLIVIQPVGNSLSDTLNWCKGHPDKLLVVAYVEVVLVELAKYLIMMSLEELESLIELKNCFKSIIKPSGLELSCEVKSRKLLVEFIVVCFSHYHCQLEYPDVTTTLLELSQDSLCMAVLRNKQQEAAALSVINYLTTVNKANKNQYLFSATHCIGTINFARKHVDECPFMSQRLGEEKIAEIASRKAYWQEVLVKKNKAQELRDTLPGLEESIKASEESEIIAKSERDDVYTSYDSFRSV